MFLRVNAFPLSDETFVLSKEIKHVYQYILSKNQEKTEENIKKRNNN